ncbi:MAG: FAD-dependent oxidoreductase [Desmonostoc geniculatum HA4340-LM1]|jgi:monoamine oxidase|nr:FAD-dependent oxidoreductase [Desmonostoc geniculatum HA4340-LM1]
MVTTSKEISRHALLEANPELSGWAAIASTRGSIAEYLKRARNHVEVPVKNIGQNKRAVIIGAGVAGLTSAYELLVNEIGCSCVILEANQRVGGRNLTVRPGDAIAEEGFEPQVCSFESEPDQPYQPYLNAGPGRIPSAHTHLLDYLRRFKVPLEIYVMDSRSNLTYMEGDFGNRSVPNRRLDNDTRGWIAEILFKFLDEYKYPDLSLEEIEQFKQLLERFGYLQAVGDNRGLYLGSDRSGYTYLPGVGPGEIEKPLQLKELLASEFWARGTSFYQPQDFLWQPTLFQPVGGMDKVVDAFKEKVEQLGGDIRLGAVVTKIAYSVDTEKYRIYFQQNGEEQLIEADYCFSNMPIPLLKGVLEDEHFDQNFQAALQAVYRAQYGSGNASADGYQAKFLADTTKVGWQAKRDLWQKAHNPGDVPIYGGISWSSDEIVQIWYPSDDYHAEFGVLTGAYNFRGAAFEWGKKPPQERLEFAKAGAKNLGGDAFANGLKRGLAIAWQNIPYQKGGWANWQAVEDKETHYNGLIQGNKNFYIIGDQLSALPGWQEGAVVSAINAVNRVTDENYFIPELDILPDTRLMVESL